MGKAVLPDITFCQLCNLVQEIWAGHDGLSWTTRTEIMMAFFRRRDMVEQLERLYEAAERQTT